MHLTAKCTVFPKIEELSQVGTFLKEESMPIFGQLEDSSKPSILTNKPYRLREASETGNFSFFGDKKSKIRAKRAASRYDEQTSNWRNVINKFQKTRMF